MFSHTLAALGGSFIIIRHEERGGLALLKATGGPDEMEGVQGGSHVHSGGLVGRE